MTGRWVSIVGWINGGRGSTSAAKSKREKNLDGREDRKGKKEDERLGDAKKRKKRGV